MENEFFMRRCLQLAAMAESYVAPNPMVGAVLVCDGKIAGEGYHCRYGQAHAEPNAINKVTDKNLLAKCTLYVNLEPCSHFGKTPPCTNLIIESKIPRVVVGTLDPNPKVAGAGVRLLREAGVDVTVGVLAAECRALNKRFFIFQEKHRPYILLKWAQTADGFIDKIREAAEKPLAISNTVTKQLTHKMRTENQAIMVGTNTVLMDNPKLLAQHWTGRNPLRVILDRQGRIPETFNVMDGKSETLIFTETKREDYDKLRFIKIDFDKNISQNVVNELFKQNINSVLVEGGAQLLNSFIASNLWDEANVEISPQTIGSGIFAPKLNVFPSEIREIEGHRCMSFFRQRQRH
jgi:diaminohydroxyphosphoribosylaminopyrimidine deaminase/5-amino-6-(5-phosphoribosylamino)uracil reductase